ncbi:DUF3592 domain-containing protein [Streptomyces sp. G45]|uniref:DUF3592 domain-containing protein n=1 Tax=Streptomyces sp. G45 TaxID=3406627 RepID=UPI003C17A997
MEIQTRVGGEKARRWLMFGMLAVGAVSLVVGLVLAGISVSFLVDAERAQGTVVALEWRSSGGDSDGGTSRRTRGDDEPTAYPVVEFRTEDGTPTRFRDSTGSNPAAYEVGERVEVLYRADSPEDARIKGFLSLWLGPLILGGIGLVFTGIGAGLAWARRRRS